MDQHIAPGSGGEARETGITPPRSLFADDAPRTPAPPPDSQAAADIVKKPFNMMTRVVLPLIIFFVAVACVAWVVQQLPGRGAKTPAKGGDGRDVRDALVFLGGEVARWDPKDEKYVAEFELGQSGHYDFPFENSSDGELDFGVAKTSCVCSKVLVCRFRDKQREEYQASRSDTSRAKVVDDGLEWIKMEVDKDMKRSISVPARGTGLVRVFWEGRKSEPEKMALDATVWNRAAGTGRDRSFKMLRVDVVYVRPVIFDNDKIELGTLGPQDNTSTSFLCWSVTRDLDVKPASKDKCILVDVTPLDNDQRQKLQTDFKNSGFHTRIRCAFRIKVTLHEQRDGKQLDMGLFKEEIPLAITSDGQRLDKSVPLPNLRASVRGDVHVPVMQDEGGRIDFKLFRAKDGTRRKLAVFAPRGAKLTFVRGEPALLDLDVTLKELEPAGSQGRWEMDVTIPPRQPGPLPEDGVIVLRCELPPQGATPSVTRLVRIPIVGSASEHQH
jgi:hypothetical protein